MTEWSRSDLDLLGDAGEVEVSSVRRDGSLSRARTVWIVRVGGELYLRSVNGPDAATEQPDVDPAVDAEYARKYRGSPAAVAHINDPLARTTTMRAEPR